MKKFLLFLCALMVSQIAGAWYLIGGGSLGNWDPASAIAYTSTEDNLEVWENISLTTDQEFKFIKQKNWDNNLGSGSNINSTGKETTLHDNGGNCNCDATGYGEKDHGRDGFTHRDNEQVDGYQRERKCCAIAHQGCG